MPFHRRVHVRYRREICRWKICLLATVLRCTYEQDIEMRIYGLWSPGWERSMALLMADSVSRLIDYLSEDSTRKAQCLPRDRLRDMNPLYHDSVRPTDIPRRVTLIVLHAVQPAISALRSAWNDREWFGDDDNDYKYWWRTTISRMCNVLLSGVCSIRKLERMLSTIPAWMMYDVYRHTHTLTHS